MEEPTSTSHFSPKALTGHVLLANDDRTNQPSLKDSRDPNPGNETDRHGVVLVTTSPGEHTTNAPELFKEESLEKSSKHPLTETSDGEELLPSPKKHCKELASDAEPVGTIDSAETATPSEIPTEDSKEDTSVVAEPAKSLQRPGAKTKPTPKKPTNKPARGRACATCKKRKVKCKHNSASEDSMVEEAGASKPAQSKDKTEAPEPSEPATHMDEPQSPKAPKPTKVPAAKKPTAPPERTSTRTRKPPSHLSSAPAPTTTTTPASATKPTSRVFNPTYITTNSTSRLAKADLYHLLTNDDSAWTSLTLSRQQKLVSMLPSSPETALILEKLRQGHADNTRPRWLQASDVFRTEVAKFQEDLRNGHLAKTWQASAALAVEERAEGNFDKWKAEEAELWWGQKSG
ncbi:hypothetical protein E8E13_000649 [Curvularia kusanoi]|uniref:ASX DEUBAD domain-containing protein n=1 Tax=Curvularia kusanoi TaxID=90978 RepID=A0A9P4TFE6_CURKU|nr:hypothetical protein E8E13_000649 [Curvularia kusanoi]